MVFESALLQPEVETKLLDVLGQLGQPKGNRLVFLQVVQLERLEFAQKDVAGQIRVFQAGEVVERLLLRLFEISAGALLFNQKNTLPEKVDEPPLVAKVLHRLFKRGNAAYGNTKHLEEVSIKELHLSLLVALASPFLGKLRGPRPNFIP